MSIAAQYGAVVGPSEECTIGSLMVVGAWPRTSDDGYYDALVLDILDCTKDKTVINIMYIINNIAA